MITASARRSTEVDESVTTFAVLRTHGWTDQAARAQLAARRWQRIGHALVLHNGTPSWSERCSIALVNHGPRSTLTSFTSVAEQGLTGWERDTVHVLVPGGARVLLTPGVRTHYTGSWESVDRHPARPLHSLAGSLVIAASSFESPRPACGLLAAAVQQRLVRVSTLRDAMSRATRTRHRAVLLAALDDIDQGAHALSEIDFARLCRRHGLPEPHRQRVRVQPDGRRRYLDVVWDLPGARRLVVEIDGALHLSVDRWISDQLRQNEIVMAGDTVLRFPSVLIRTDDPQVVDQIRRALR